MVSLLNYFGKFCNLKFIYTKRNQLSKFLFGLGNFEALLKLILYFGLELAYYCHCVFKIKYIIKMLNFNFLKALI